MLSTRVLPAVVSALLFTTRVLAEPIASTEDEETWERWGIATKRPTGFTAVAPRQVAGTAFYPWIVDLRWGNGGNQSCTAQSYRGVLHVECEGRVYQVKGPELVHVPGTYGTIVGNIQGGLLSLGCDKYECFATTYTWKSPTGIRALSADVALGDTRGMWLFTYEDPGGLLPLASIKGQAWGKPHLAHPKGYPGHLGECGVDGLFGDAESWIFDLRCEKSRRLLVWDGHVFAEFAVPEGLGEARPEGLLVHFEGGPHYVHLASRPLSLVTDPLYRTPPDRSVPSGGEVHSAALSTSVRWHVEGPRRIVEQQVGRGEWTPLPLSPEPLGGMGLEVFVYDQDLWILSEEGLLSTRRPRRLWVASHPGTMMESDFAPSPLFAAPGCPSPFQVRYTSGGTYAQAVQTGRTYPAVFPPAGESTEGYESAEIYSRYEGGLWYFGEFIESVPPKDSRSQTLCIAKSSVARVRVR